MRKIMLLGALFLVSCHTNRSEIIDEENARITRQCIQELVRCQEVVKKAIDAAEMCRIKFD